VSFGSTLGMYATSRPFVSLVPGHPSQLPIGPDRYGIPPNWPDALRPAPDELAELEQLVDDVGQRFTGHWNEVLAVVAPHASPVDDAFRVHGDRVLYNSPVEIADQDRRRDLAAGHRFVGPLVRHEARPSGLDGWAHHGDQPLVYVALGTFLSHRGDVLARIAEALRRCGARAAIATGPTGADALGPIPDGWIVAPTLPQVGLLAEADLAIHHGGNNSVQESLASGVRQLVLPFSTDQFANAYDLERCGYAAVAAPNTATIAELAELVERSMAGSRPTPIGAVDSATLVAPLGDPAPVAS